MPYRPGSDKMLYRLVLVFIILALCIGSAGYLYYNAQKLQIKKNVQDELSAIADLKVNQIAAWRKERIGDATIISRSNLITAQLHQFLKNPATPGLKQDILAWMNSLQDVFGYRSTLLVDTTGAVRISTVGKEGRIGPYAKEVIQTAVNTQTAILSDFHAAAVIDYPHLDLVAPLMIHQGKKVVPVGALLIRLNPEEYLYPLIQSWPGTSKTAETILIRREGDQIVFLNVLRHRKDAPLSYRVPFDEKKLLPLSKAVQGQRGVYEAIDYRMVPVLAAVRPVPETNWFLVSKVDIDEIYAPIHKQAWLMLVVIGVLIMTSGLGIIFWWRQKSAEHARKQYELELERQYLSSRYNYLSKYANDCILLVDPSGKIMEANDRAVTAYGYSHDELLQLNIRDLRPAETIDQVDAQMQKVREHGGLIFETVHKRKNGTTFPVEVSSRVVDLGEKSFYQSVIRDISERKQAEIALINEKNRSNAIISAIGDGITIQDRDFRIIYQNQVHKDTYGDRVGEYCYQAYQQRDAVCDACLMAEVFLDGKIHRAVRTSPAERGKRSLEITSSPLKDETGEIIAGIAVVRDITARLQAQTTLKERNAFIEAITDNMPIGLSVNTIKDGKVIYMNSAFEDIYGWPRQSMESVEEFFTNVYPDPVYREEIKGKILSDIAGGDPSRMRWENIAITTKAGKKKLVTALNIPLFEQGTMISTVQDVTAYKLSEGRLTKLNECFLSFGPDPNENINRLVALSGQQLEAACALYNRLDGDILHSLGQWNTPPGYNPTDKPEGHICYDVIKEGGNDVCVIRDLPVTSYAQTDPNVARYGLKTYIGKAVSFGGKFVGSLCVVYQNDREPSDEELKFLGIVAAAVGVEENRKGTIKALVDSENRYKHLIESVTDYIYTVEVESGRPVSTFHGTGCVAVTGYTSEEYHSDPELWLRMIVEEDRELVLSLSKKILSGIPVPPFEHRIIHKDGSLHWVRNTQVPRYDMDGRIIAYEGLITDVTQLKMLENQLRQAQKMEAVGQLSGGIAHDFNNILTAIIGYANLLLMKMSKDDELGRSYIEQILSSSERAAHLTHSLLAFSRKQIIDLRPVNLNDIIKRVEKILIRVIGEDIEFKIRLAADLPILADSVHIEQVFMNLATNARDAMPDGGTLLIEAKPVELREEFVRTHTYFKPGRYASISVTDTGIGMDEITKNRIFEPFFTTKDVGKGTGLGLSMVYGIIKQHKGYIMVSSELGRGTTFAIYLPLITALAEKQKPKETAVVIKRGTETVLIAEDDTAVRDLTRSILEDFGYKVIEAIDGEEAVRKFIENKDVVKILVFDIIMPKKNGKEAYLEIKKMRPDIKALFVSGYTADIIHQKGIMETGLDFIVKPIAPNAFLKKIREVLEKS